jgi:adhesin/invasin
MGALAVKIHAKNATNADGVSPCDVISSHLKQPTICPTPQRSRFLNPIWFRLGPTAIVLIALTLGPLGLAQNAALPAFTSIVNGGDGTVVPLTPQSGYDRAFQIIGNDNEQGGIFTEYVATATQDTLVEYLWAYATDDGPVWDPAGYTLAGERTRLTDSSGGNRQSGSGWFVAPAGQSFGWYVESTDGCCGRGFLTVNVRFPIAAGDGQSATVGTAVSVPPTVQVFGNDGLPASGVAVTFSVVEGGGTITGATTTTNQNGIASIGSWTLGPRAGTNTLQASAGNLLFTFTATATPRIPSDIAYPQTPLAAVYGTAGSSTDATLNDGGETVSFTLATQPASTEITIDPQTGGISWSDALLPGVYQLTVTASNSAGSATASVTLTVTPAPLTLPSLVVTQSKVYDGNQTAAVATGTLTGVVGGDDVDLAVTATYADAQVGTPTITVDFSLSGTDAFKYTAPENLELPGTITARPVTVTANPQSKVFGELDPPLNYSVQGELIGSETFSGALARAPGEDAGSYAIGLGSLVLSTNYLLTFEEASFVITPMNLNSANIIIEPIPAQVFTGMGIEPAVVVLDGEAVLLPGVDYTLVYTGNTAVGPATVTITGTGNYTGTAVTTFVIEPAAISQLVLVNQPQRGASGEVLAGVAGPFVVEVRDFGENRVTAGSVPITVTVLTGAGGVLGGATTVDSSQGQAVFSSLTLAGLVETDYVLQFSSGALTPVNSLPIQLTPGALATFEILAANGQALASQVAGTPFAVRIRALDAPGNVVTTFTEPVTITSTATLSDAPLTTEPLTAGVLANQTLTLTSSGSATLTVSGGQPQVVSTSAPFQVTPGEAAAGESTLTLTPQTAVAADGVSQATLTMTVRDEFGNTVAGAPVTFAITNGTGGTISGSPWSTAADGTATATLSSSVANTLTVTASLGSGAVVSGVSVEFVPGSASRVAVQTEPVGGASGGLLNVQPQIEIQDANGNRLTDSTATVTVALAPGTTGVLAGTTSVDAVNGVASFSDLTLAGPIETEYLLTFTADGLATATSQPVTLTPGEAASGTSELTVTPTVAPLLADGRSTVLLELVVRDAQGNRLDRGGDTVLFTSNLGSISAVSDAGDGSYSAILTAGTVPGSARVEAAVNGVVQSASAEVVFILATAELLLELGARRFGDATAPFGPLPAVLPGDVLELRLSFLNNGTDAASDILLVVDLPLSFVLVPGPGGSDVAVVCPGLVETLQAVEAIVSAGRLLASAAGLQLRVPVDEVCESSDFVPGEGGSVTFRVGVQ